MTSLGSTTVSDVLALKKVTQLLTVPASTSIAEALERMHYTDVGSLVVTADTTSNSYVGVVNVFDLMNYMIGFVETVGLDATALVVDKSHLQDPVTNAMGLSLEGRVVYSYDKDERLGPVLEAFALGVHRVLVTDATGMSPTRIMTQTDVAKFILHQQSAAIPADVTVSQFGLFEEPGTGVLTITATDTALQGFNKLAVNEVTAVAVVDSDGKLVATLSASDMRAMTERDIADVTLPVLQFLQKRPNIRDRQYVATGATLVREALATMIEKHVHRLWVVDGENKPRGVVTLSDVITKVAKSN